jgi:phosphate transport system permease protein
MRIDYSRELIRDNSTNPLFEAGIHAFFLACACITIAATIGIIVVLFGGALDFFAEVSPWEFLTGHEWSPTIQPYKFGVLPLITGTLTITIGSAIVALPIGVATAIFLSEFASNRVRGIVKPLLEVLAGIPTVVYGYFALVYITPVLENIFPGISAFNALSASIVVGIMIIPFVSSVSEDAMNAVPNSLRQAGYGLGATKFDVSLKIVLPASVSGVVASFILALSRAIGETMAVTIAAGQNPQLVTPWNLHEKLLGPIETMTAAIVKLAKGDLVGDSAAYRSLYAIGLVLFLTTFTMNLIGSWVSSRYKEKYE